MTTGPSDHIHLWPLSTRSRHGGGAVVEAQNRWLVQMPRAVAPEVVEMDLGRGGGKYGISNGDLKEFMGMYHYKMGSTTKLGI